MSELVFHDVSLAYRTKEKIYPVFSHLSFSLDGPGFVALLGESGSGKSTLLSLIAGYLTPDQGKIRLREKQEDIGFVFQDHHLLNHLNVIDNVALPLLLVGYRKEEAEIKANEALKQCGINELSTRKIEEISGGQKARVAVARALVKESSLLLLDEPTGALDEENAMSMMQLFQELGKTHLVIMVTHSEHLAFRYASKVFLLKESRLSLIKDNKAYQGKMRGKKNGRSSSVRLRENLFLASSFLRKRKMKVLFAMLFISVCLGLLMGLCGIIRGGGEEIRNLAKDCYSYTAFNLNERKEYRLSEKDISIYKKVSLSDKTKQAISNKNKDVRFFSCLDNFIKPVNEVRKNDIYLSDKIAFSPSFPSKERLKEGRVPSSFPEVIISPSLAEQGVRIGEVLEVKEEYVIKTDIEGEIIRDLYQEQFLFKVSGIAREKDLLSRPTVYYDYPLLFDHLSSFKLKSLSSFLKREITLKERLDDYSDADDELTSFKTLAYAEDAYEFKNFLNSSFPQVQIVSLPLALASSLEEMIEAFSKVLLIFLGLSAFCSLLLLLIVLFSLYKAKEQEFALYFSFHITEKEFYKLGEGTVIILSLYLIMLSLASTLIIIPFLNHFLLRYGFTPFLNLRLVLPFLSLLPLLAFFCTTVTNYIPLKRFCSKDLVFTLKGGE